MAVEEVTSSRSKPFSEMTAEEKKQRVKQLWRFVRINLRLIRGFVRDAQEKNDRRNYNQMGGVDISEDDWENNDGEPPKKWYIIVPTNSCPALWEMIINTLTIYSLFAIPFLLVFPDLYTDQVKSVEFFLDIMFTFDLFLNFFKAYKEEETFKQTALTAAFF